MKKAAGILFIFSCFITFLILFPYTRYLATNLPNTIDPVFYAWNIGHNLQSFAQKGEHLLNTNIFYPETNTLALSDTLYAQTISLLPLRFFTENVVWMENAYIVLTFPLAAVFMFFLAYYITENILASVISGFFYAFSYPRLSQIGHMPMVSSQWIPLFVLFLLKYLEKGSRKSILLVCVLYILNITSSMYFGVFVLLYVLIAVIIECFHWIRNRSWALFKRISFQTILFAIPTLIILCLVLFPYIRLKAEYPGIQRPFDDAVRFSAQLIDYLTILPTSLIARLNIFPTATNEKPLYPTVTLLILALCGIYFGWKKQKKYVIFFTLSGITALLLSFGPYIDIIDHQILQFRLTMPYYYLYQAVPILQIIRVPARLSIIFILSLSVLSGIALAHIRHKRTFITVSIVCFVLFFAEVWQIQTPSVPIPIDKQIPAVYRWLSNAPDADIIVELPLLPASNIEISMEDQLFIPYSRIKDIDTYALETYRIYFSVFHRKRMLNGYSGFFPQVYHDQVNVLQFFPDAASITLLEKLKVRYIIIHGWQYTKNNFADIQKDIAKYPAITLKAQFDQDYVYEIIKK